MPCYQRRRHHPRHGGGFRFHPYFHPRFHPFFSDEDEAVTAHLLSVFQNDKARFDEESSDAVYSIAMDLPGVKAHQVTVEETNGEIEITAFRTNEKGDLTKTYQDIMYVHPRTADLGNIQALLTDGVLTVTVPKVSNEPLVVVAEAGSPPEPLGEENEFRVSLDLPGVKPSNLQLQYRPREQQAHVKATRTIATRIIEMERTIDVKSASSSIDMEQARAFLCNGVFTLVAPVNREMDTGAENGSNSMKTIVVTDGDALPSMASLHLDDSSMSNDAEDDSKKPAASNLVETVNAEEDEKEEWEEVKTDVPAAAAANNNDN